MVRLDRKESKPMRFSIQRTFHGTYATGEASSRSNRTQTRFYFSNVDPIDFGALETQRA